MIGQQRRRSKSTKVRLQLESLESRRLMAANVWRGALTVSGSPGNDTIVVQRNAQDSRTIEVIENGQVTSSVPLSSIRSIRIDGGNGDDVIRVDQANGRIALPTTLYGGVGDDEFVAAAGINRIDGGTGRNVYESGGGRDIVARASLADSLQRFGSTEAFRRYMISAAAKRHTFGGVLDENGNATRPLASRAAGLESEGVPTDAVYGSTELRTSYAEPLNPTAPASLANPWVVKMTGEPPADAIPVTDSPSTLRDANGTFYTTTASPYFRPNLQHQVEYKILAVDDARLFGFRNGEVFGAEVTAPHDAQWRQPVAGEPVASYLHEGRLSLVTEVSGAPVPGSSIAMQPLRDRTGKQVVVSVFDVTDEAAVHLVSSTRIDGTYFDSRFIDGRLTLVVRNDLLAGYWKGITAPNSPGQSNPEAAPSISNGVLVNLVRRAAIGTMLPAWRTTSSSSGAVRGAGSGLLTSAEAVLCPALGIEPDLFSFVKLDATAASPTVNGVMSCVGSYATKTFLSGNDFYVFSSQRNGTQTLVHRIGLSGSLPTVVSAGLLDGSVSNSPLAVTPDGSVKVLLQYRLGPVGAGGTGGTTSGNLSITGGALGPQKPVFSDGLFSRQPLTMTLQQPPSSTLPSGPWGGGTGGTGGTGSTGGGGAFGGGNSVSLSNNSAGAVLGIAVFTGSPPPDTLYRLATLQTRGSKLELDAKDRLEWAGCGDAVYTTIVTGATTQIVSILPTASTFSGPSVMFSDAAMEVIGNEPRLPAYPIILQPWEEDFLVGIARERNLSTGATSSLKVSFFNNPLESAPSLLTSFRIQIAPDAPTWSDQRWEAYAQHVAAFLRVGVWKDYRSSLDNSGPATVIYEIRVSYLSPTEGPA